MFWGELIQRAYSEAFVLEARSYARISLTKRIEKYF